MLSLEDVTSAVKTLTRLSIQRETGGEVGDESTVATNPSSALAVEESMEIVDEDQIMPAEEEYSDDDPNKLWCICRKPHNKRFMLCCDGCDEWFHGRCVNVTRAQCKSMTMKNILWYCPNCKTKLGKENGGGSKQNENRDCPAAEGSRTTRQRNTRSSQSGKGNQEKSEEPKPGPSSANPGLSTLSQLPETNVSCSKRNHGLGQSNSSVHVSRDVIQPEFYERLHLSCGTLGHLSPIYCVLFDVSGKFIFTGADDSLVKIWSAVEGRLLATLRGASSEISDLAVNHGNTLLAAGSCDKLIRVWSLRTCAPIAVLDGHSGNITSLFFCPIPRSRHPVAYLASTSNDGSCSFWGFTENQEAGQVEFKPSLTHYPERSGHIPMICLSFSSGGIFMAAGSADNKVRVFNMLGQEGPERVLEAEFNKDRVSSISWAHEGLRFISGSIDGTALVWRFDNGEWRFVRLHCSAKVLGSNMVIHEAPKKRARVTMVAWNTHDTLVLTAVSDNLLKIWNPQNGELIRLLEGHSDAFYVIESHPLNPRIICTAGHDGKIIIWDIGSLNKEERGRIIFQYHNTLDQGLGHYAVFDCMWAPDGLSLAATDSHGQLLIFTTQEKADSKFSKLPREIFFHTDYRQLTRNAITNEVLDELTQVPPHLMAPPFLVDRKGKPYPPDLQKLVPGRESCKQEQLIPKVAIGKGGLHEVIDGLPGTGPYGFPERNVIMPLSKEELARSEEQRLRLSEKEETIYKESISRRPASSPSEHESVVMPTGALTKASTPRKNSVSDASSRNDIAESETSSEDEYERRIGRFYTKAFHLNESKQSSSRQLRTSASSTSTSTHKCFMNGRSPRNELANF